MGTSAFYRSFEMLRGDRIQLYYLKYYLGSIDIRQDICYKNHTAPYRLHAKLWKELHSEDNKNNREKRKANAKHFINAFR